MRPFTQNLESARQYMVAEDSKAALNILKRILGTLDTVSAFPEASKVSKQKQDTRQIMVPNTPLIIADRIHNNAEELLALWRQAQTWP